MKKVGKYKLKLKTKPWLTPGLPKSVSIKNKMLTKYIEMKNRDKKLELLEKYKDHRNLLSTLIKQSRHKYLNKYFEDIGKLE